MENVFATHWPYVRIRKNTTFKRTGRTKYSSISYVLVYNESELTWVQSGSIPYVLVSNEYESIRIWGELNASWYKHGVVFSNGE